MLSDILGIDIATRLARYAKRDRQTYFAHRHETMRHREIGTPSCGRNADRWNAVGSE